MEGNRISSSKLKRKPLSDCTNTRPNSKLKSKSLTLAKPTIKPYIFPQSTNNNSDPKKNINPNINSNSNNDVVVFRSSVNSCTSAGSNISPNSDSVPSQSPTPLSRGGAVVHRKSGRSATLTQRQDEQTNKDRGRSVVTTSIIQASAYLTSQPVQIPSSGNGGHVITPPEVENHEIEQRRRDKGKMVVESPIISDPLTSHALPTLSSTASGNFYLPEPSAVHSHNHNHNQDAQVKKDFRRTDLEIHSAEASGPTTPHSLISSSSAIGTDGLEKTGLIVYNQRRSSQRKKLVGNISFAFSCPPDKRTKKKGVQLDGGGDGHSGLHTYLVPEHKKARYKKDNSVHAMPQDEVEKLKAYYASIDSFELPEEVASETELD